MIENKAKIILITACNLFPNHGGDRLISWGLLKKLNETVDVYFINIINENDYSEEEISYLETFCKSLYLIKENYFPTPLAFFLSYCYKDAFMLVRRKKRNEITLKVSNIIKAIKPDKIIWDHVRSTSYFSKNTLYNILLEHNYEPGIYEEKIKLYPKILYQVLKLQVNFADSFNRKANSVMQKVVYLNEQDATKYNLSTAVVWQYRNITFNHSNYQVVANNIIRLLFVGSLEWYPNIEGISWFIDNVLPLLDDKFKLTVVGKSPSEQFITKIGNNKRITGHFDVPSVEPFYLESDIFVSPIFLGLGVNMKIIEASSYGIPMVVTNHSLKGYNYLNFLPVANDEFEFCNQLNRLSDISIRNIQNSALNKWYKSYLNEADNNFETVFNLHQFEHKL